MIKYDTIVSDELILAVLKMVLSFIQKTLSIIALSFIVFVLANVTYANKILPTPFELVKDEVAAQNYLGAINLLRSQEKAYLASEYQLLYFDLLATYESFLNMYQEALKDDDLARKKTQYNQKLYDIEKYELRGAKEAIINASQMHQVIFINEAHHYSLHRAFTLSLLQDLYNNGFRYFAAETLNESDTEVNLRGYPLQGKTGYYTDETLHGELIRAAHKIGYKIIPYESVPDCDPWHTSPEVCQNLREVGQAKNLYERIFKSDSSAKLLVHAGYSHIAKKGIESWIPMAVYFKQLSGISPYTIDQTLMREHSLSQYENPIFREIDNAGLLKDASVLSIDDSMNLIPAYYRDAYDLIIFHPRTQYKNNRPTWLFALNKRKIYPVPVTICKNNYPCLIEAFIDNEEPESVPSDRVVITTQKDQVNLALLPGNYTLRAKDKLGNLLTTINSIVPF